jgi:ribosomal protein S18 acetylase RimI-like enzyme
VLKLKLITREDLEWARTSRNDNRQFFMHQKTITPKTQEYWFIGNRSQFFIVWLDGKRVGTISVNKENEIGNVLILPEYRGKGLFKKVIKLIEKDFGKHLSLEVRVDNDDAIKVYEKLGFKLVAYKMTK